MKTLLEHLARTEYEVIAMFQTVIELPVSSGATASVGTLDSDRSKGPCSKLSP